LRIRPSVRFNLGFLALVLGPCFLPGQVFVYLIGGHHKLFAPVRAFPSRVEVSGGNSATKLNYAFRTFRFEKIIPEEKRKNQRKNKI
jgi:hypothetical protein